MLGVPTLSELWSTRGAVPLGPDHKDLGCQSEVSAHASLLSAWGSGQAGPTWGGTTRAEMYRPLRPGLPPPGLLRRPKNCLRGMGLQAEA